MIIESQTQSHLSAAVARVILATTWVPKDKETESGPKYPYTSVEAMVNGVRRQMAEQGLVVFLEPAELNELQPGVTKNGAEVCRWMVSMRVELVHAPSGERRSSTWTVEANDTGDKALLKAYTVILREYLAKLFLIPKGDDPEATQLDMESQKSPAMELTERLADWLEGHGLRGAFEAIKGRAKGLAKGKRVETTHVERAAKAAFVEPLAADLKARWKAAGTNRTLAELLEELNQRVKKALAEGGDASNWPELAKQAHAQMAQAIINGANDEKQTEGNHSGGQAKPDDVREALAG